MFERALADAGLEFRSDKLWETYVDWLKERGNRESVGKMSLVFDRLLQTPTQHYKRHFTTLVFIFGISGTDNMCWSSLKLMAFYTEFYSVSEFKMQAYPV